jgi:ribosomal protein S18 acetylase RimI-like enzyme
MKPIKIRKAIPSDLDTLFQFEQGIANAERPFDPTLKPGPYNYYDLGLMIKDPLVHVVVAEHNGQLIGSGYARIEKSKPYLTHEYHSYLGFMYVVPEWRGKNINQMIMEELKRWSQSKGMTELRLDVYLENTAAVKAYEKAGFEKLLVNMRMGLDRSY